MARRPFPVLVALSAFAGAASPAAAADPPPVAAAEEYDAQLPAQCRQPQKNRAGAECFVDSAAGVSARAWSRDPNEPESSSRATCLATRKSRLTNAPPVQTLRYEVCNLNRSKDLYFQWVAAGFQSGSRSTDLLRFRECACFDREVAKSKHDPASFEANKPSRPYTLETWQPVPSGVIGRVFDLAQTLHIVGPDRSGQSRPKLRFWMRTYRDLGKVVTELAYETQNKVYIALPDIKSDAEERLLEQLGFYGFKGSDAQIVPTDVAVAQIAEDDRPSVAAAFPKNSRVLVLSKLTSPTQVRYNWQSDTTQLADLPVAITDPDGRLRSLIHYATTDNAR